MMTTASALSNQVSAILKQHDFTFSAPGPDISGAREALLEKLGSEKADKIEAVLTAGAATVLAGRNLIINVPNDLKAHTAYSDAFNDLCGYPDEAMARIAHLLGQDWTMDEIASEWGWRVERLKEFYAGDRSAYFKN